MEASDRDDWALVKTSDDGTVRVHQRDNPDGYREFRAVTRVDSTPLQRTTLCVVMRIVMQIVLTLSLVVGCVGALAAKDGENGIEASSEPAFSPLQTNFPKPFIDAEDAHLELMKRLREVVEALKSEGPVPVDCMEG